LASLLPSAIARFVESNIWEFLLQGPVTVTPVGGQTYLGMPGNFMKIDSLWSETLGYALDFKSRKTWSRHRAAQPAASGSPVIYTQIGGKVYPFPPAAAGDVFKAVYYPKPANFQIEDIDFGHYAILQMLIEDALPAGAPDSPAAAVKAFYGRKVRYALEDATATQNVQPDTQEDEALDLTQQRLNSMKGDVYVPRSPFAR